jgi:hypothetical protein
MNVNLPNSLFHFIREFESADCQVTRRGNQIIIRPPCWDMAFFPMGQLGLGEQLHALLGDEITLDFQDGHGVHMSFQYWKPFRIFQHLAISMLFGSGLLFEQSPNLGATLLGMLAGNLIVTLITFVSLYPCLKAFTAARKKAYIPSRSPRSSG